MARDAIEHQTYPDSGAVILEKYFDYDKNTFDAKLEEIYDFYRDQAARMKPWELDEARADIVNDRVHSGPYNQNDGAWLRFVANTGTLDDVRGFLFDVWSDEFGNGNPALHHGNLFTTFLRGLNITLPGRGVRGRTRIIRNSMTATSVVRSSKWRYRRIPIAIFPRSSA